MHRIVRILIRLLPHADREPVLGDLCECGVTGAAAVLDLCGLILRRALQPYRQWRSWLGIGAAIPLSFLLIGISVSAATQFHAWRFEGATSAQSTVELVRLLLLLCLVSTLEGFAAYTLSRARISLLCALMATSSICFHSFHRPDVSAWSVFLCVPALALGAWMAHRRVSVTRGDAVGWSVLLLAILWPTTVEDVSQWWNGLLLLIPILLCFITVSGRQRNAVA